MAKSCVDFAEFAEDREPLLREFLSLENGLPSHDTFSRVFRLLDPAAFGRAFSAFLDDLGEAGAGVPATMPASRACPALPPSRGRPRSATRPSLRGSTSLPHR